MKRNGKISFDRSRKILPFLTSVLAVLLFAVLLITRLNSVSLVCVFYMGIISVLILAGIVFKRRIYLYNLLGYAVSGAGVILFGIFCGADSGFGAFTSAAAGFRSEDNFLFTGNGGTVLRAGGAVLLALPTLICLYILLLSGIKSFGRGGMKKPLSLLMSILLTLTTAFYVLTVNVRSKPVTERLWDGQDDYLNRMAKHGEDSPNVLVILLDDLGWGDVSANGSLISTPNIDSIGENGLEFDNFYSSYSVCSPARFALMTGRYPFRGYADNVIYPSVNSFSPFAATRFNNSFEMGANCDGMLGDEITAAEAFSAAGYKTACFGKWHLGDYGEYLPTNQGFDYFYGSHYVNDMSPFYHVREENGEYEIIRGSDELRDQSRATEWINEEMFSWIDKTLSESDDPFFVYYASPWPHAPVFAGDGFDGATGLGTYADCVTETDYYLGLLFEKLEKAGVLDDTVIVFTSDNGPALEGSTGELRGGKYLTYEGGQKVPFAIRWDNNPGIWEKGETRDCAATLVDLFPTLCELCRLKDKNGVEAYLPSDRIIDGVSMLPILENDTPVHLKDTPILYMKREKLKAIQYAVPTADILSREEYSGYGYSVLTGNEYADFKYFRKIQNDNSAFFDKFRKNWLHILTDDAGENYNRSSVFPTVASEMNGRMDEIMNSFRENRRGVK